MCSGIVINRIIFVGLEKQMAYRQIYDISFVPYQEAKGINSHIVFSMDKRNLEVFQIRLRSITHRFDKDVEKYLGVHSDFTPLNKDLFGNYTFGYNNCGYVSIEKGNVLFHFELCYGPRVHYVSMTIMALLWVLNSMLYDEEDKPTYRSQFIQIDTVCNNVGHPIGGWISADFGVWLKKQVESSFNKNKLYKTRLPAVEDVMCQTWNKITRGKLKKDGWKCRAIIATDGRFSLVCPGDACNVSISPDQSNGALGTQQVQFSYNNLSYAAQQLTLLAGIAKLCDLAHSGR